MLTGMGIRNVYLGTYIRTDGTVLEGPSLSELVAALNPAVDSQHTAELHASEMALQAVKDAGEALIMATVEALRIQTAPSPFWDCRRWSSKARGQVLRGKELFYALN